MGDVDAGPTGGDERVEAARLTDDNLASLAIELTADPDDYVYGPTVLAAVVELRERRAADAVTAQDPAPRAEPVAWMHEVERPYRPALTDDPGTADWWRRQNGRRVVPLYRDPAPAAIVAPTDTNAAPATVVPDEADQATAALRTYLGPRVGDSTAWLTARARLLDFLDNGGRLLSPAEADPTPTPVDEPDLCGCDRPDLAEDPHRHPRDEACALWAGIRDEVQALAAPTPVVPDEADQATAGAREVEAADRDLRARIAWAISLHVTTDSDVSEAAREVLAVLNELPDGEYPTARDATREDRS